MNGALARKEPRCLEQHHHVAEVVSGPGTYDGGDNFGDLFRTGTVFFHLPRTMIISPRSCKDVIVAGTSRDPMPGYLRSPVLRGIAK
jgi:hypothetical protein